MDTERKHIPFFPFGWPDGPIQDVLETVCVKAFGLDANQRSVALPTALQEITSPDGRPSEELMLERFIHHAQRIYRPTDTFEPILLISFLQDEGLFLYVVDALLRNLSFLRVQSERLAGSGGLSTPSSTHVLLLENAEAAYRFGKGWPNLGTLSGDIHKGAVLYTLARGRWMILPWGPSVPNEELGRTLRSFLSTGVGNAIQERESSNPPPTSDVSKKRPRVRKSHPSGTMPAVHPPKPGLVDKLRTILRVSEADAPPDSKPPDRP